MLPTPGGPQSTIDGTRSFATSPARAACPARRGALGLRSLLVASAARARPAAPTPARSRQRTAWGAWARGEPCSQVTTHPRRARALRAGARLLGSRSRAASATMVAWRALPRPQRRARRASRSAPWWCRSPCRRRARDLGVGLAADLTPSRGSRGRASPSRSCSRGSPAPRPARWRRSLLPATWRELSVRAPSEGERVSVVLTGVLEPPLDGRGHLQLVAFDAAHGRRRAEQEVSLDAGTAGASVLRAVESLCEELSSARPRS